MSYLGLLKQTCNISRATISQGSGGELDESWEDVATSVKCSIQMTTISREEYSSMYGGEATRTTFVGFFPYGTDIREGDRVVMQDNGDNRIFHVNRGPIIDTVGRKHHIEVDLELVDATN